MVFFELDGDETVHQASNHNEHRKNLIAHLLVQEQKFWKPVFPFGCTRGRRDGKAESITPDVTPLFESLISLYLG